MRNLREEKGSVSVMVLVTILFIIVILSATFVINSTQRKSQLLSQRQLKETYEADTEKVEEIYESLPGGSWEQLEDGTISNGKVKLQIGDYISYDHTEGATITTITSFSVDNGYSNQVFNLNSYQQGWRLLGADNGRLLLISEDIIGPDSGGYEDSSNGNKFFLKGKDGYVNGVTELNKICEMYGQGDYAEAARSVNREDINKITGYNPDTARYFDGEDVSYQWRNEVTYTIGTEDEYVYGQGTKFPTAMSNPNKHTSFTYYDGTEWKTLKKGESKGIKQNFYYYYPTTLSTNDVGEVIGIAKSSAAYDMLFSGTLNKNYWLGTSLVSLRIDYVAFSICRVNDGKVTGANVEGEGLYGSYDYPREAYNGVRPVVYLKSNVELVSVGNNTWDIVK